ncbi:hypothetical protein V6N13_130608 [Hibiscus sabdariffa]
MKKEWDRSLVKESESSAEKLKKQSSSCGDSPDYILALPTLTQLYDRDWDDNNQLVMQSRVQTCSFCHKQHAGECWKWTRRCLNCGSLNHVVGECPKNPNRNPTTTASTQFSRNREHSTRSSSQAYRPIK